MFLGRHGLSLSVEHTELAARVAFVGAVNCNARPMRPDVNRAHRTERHNNEFLLAKTLVPWSKSAITARSCLIYECGQLRGDGPGSLLPPLDFAKPTRMPRRFVKTFFCPPPRQNHARGMLLVVCHASALQAPAATTRRVPTTRHHARSAPVVMKRPWYLPEKEEKGDKWSPGDEPSLKGFLAGFIVGFDGAKAKVDQKDYVADEDEEVVEDEAKEAEEGAQQEPER